MAKSGPYMKNQLEKFSRQREKNNYSAPLLFCFYHICSKNYPQDPSSDSHATTREQFNGDRQFNHPNDSLGKTKIAFCFHNLPTQSI